MIPGATISAHFQLVETMHVGAGRMGEKFKNPMASAFRRGGLAGATTRRLSISTTAPASYFPTHVLRETRSTNMADDIDAELLAVGKELDKVSSAFMLIVSC